MICVTKQNYFILMPGFWGGQNYIWENILNYFEIKELDIGRSPSIEWSKFVTSETEWILFFL